MKGGWETGTGRLKDSEGMQERLLVGVLLVGRCWNLGEGDELAIRRRYEGATDYYQMEAIDNVWSTKSAAAWSIPSALGHGKLRWCVRLLRAALKGLQS